MQFFCPELNKREARQRKTRRSKWGSGEGEKGGKFVLCHSPKRLSYVGVRVKLCVCGCASESACECVSVRFFFFSLCVVIESV